MLAFLLDGRKTWAPVDFPWEHPRAAEAPAQVREELLQARIFSEVMHGAAILYNLMLAEKVNPPVASGGDSGRNR